MSISNDRCFDVRCCSAKELLSGLHPGSVGMVATDPPWMISRKGNDVHRRGGKFGIAQTISLDFGCLPANEILLADQGVKRANEIEVGMQIYADGQFTEVLKVFKFPFKGNLRHLYFAELQRQIAYKMSWAGGEVRQVDRFFPSSRLCGACGLINSELTLADREWVCECGARHDRDLNAANNLAIKCFGPMVGGPCAWTVRCSEAPDEARSGFFTLVEERRPSRLAIRAGLVNQAR